jgi:hypothetical protein
MQADMEHASEEERELWTRRRESDIVLYLLGDGFFIHGIEYGGLREWTTPVVHQCRGTWHLDDGAVRLKTSRPGRWPAFSFEGDDVGVLENDAIKFRLRTFLRSTEGEP